MPVLCPKRRGCMLMRQQITGSCQIAPSAGLAGRDTSFLPTRERRGKCVGARARAKTAHRKLATATSDVWRDVSGLAPQRCRSGPIVRHFHPPPSRARVTLAASHPAHCTHARAPFAPVEAVCLLRARSLAAPQSPRWRGCAIVRYLGSRVSPQPLLQPPSQPPRQRIYTVIIAAGRGRPGKREAERSAP